MPNEQIFDMNRLLGSHDRRVTMRSLVVYTSAEMFIERR